MLEHIDKLHEAGKHDEAFDELTKLNNGDSDPEILWRLARARHQIASRLADKDPEKKLLLDEAHGYANLAYKMSGDDFNVLKWMAAVTGSRTDFLGTKEKIEQGNIFKDLLDKALTINPEESSLLHMRGRFSFSVAGLSWFERKAASALFAKPPEATYDDAIKDFLAVDRLRSDWLENLLFLGKSYFAKGGKSNAELYLERAVRQAEADKNGGEESEAAQEAKALLKKCKK